MVESRLTNFRTKKDLLHSEKTTDAERNAFADQFLDAERFGEALEFLERTRDRGRLDRILAEAVRRGDTFLLTRVERIRGEPVSPETWRETAGKAVELGKSFDAYRALGRAGGEEEAEAFRAEHLPDYHPFKPEGK
jgi:hypothetical protein